MLRPVDDLSGYGDADDALNILADGFLQGFILGDDYYISGAILALAAYWFHREVRTGGRPMWVAAVALGIACTTRLNTLPVLAVVALLAAKRAPAKRTYSAIGVAFVTSGLLVLPWYLVTLGEFGPLEALRIAGPPPVRAVGGLLLVCLLLVVWRLQRLSVAGPTLNVALLPTALHDPIQVNRAATYFWFGVPALARSSGLCRSADEQAGREGARWLRPARVREGSRIEEVGKELVGVARR